MPNKDRVLSIWKEFFEQYLNENFEKKPHANQELSRKNYVTIDLPSRDEIVEAIKYLKDNKVASADSEAAKLLNSDGPSLDCSC
jgi:hypothetical protein